MSTNPGHDMCGCQHLRREHHAQGCDNCSCRWFDRAAEPDDEVDMINRPPHYAVGIEPIDAIESWGLGFCLGNAVKYIARAAHKGAALQDLQKARWYLDRAIAARRA